MTAVHPNHEFIVQALVRRRLPRGAKVLDYGCGAGEVVLRARSEGYDAHGVDVFYEGGSYREEAQRIGLLGDRILELVDGKIPHPESSFDAVVSNQVLEHVENLDLVLGEIGRVLKPGGEFVTLFPSRTVWREGHVGIPFLHLLPRGHGVRYWYVYALRSLGLGYNKAAKSRRDWTRDAISWVDKYTYYRPWGQIEEALNRHVGRIQREEPDFLRFRTVHLGAIRRLVDATVTTGVGRALLIAFVERYSGLVLIVRKRAAVDERT